MTNIIKAASGLYGSPATEFEKIKVPDRAYVELYRQGVALPSGQHNIQADVGDYILIVKAWFTPGHAEVIDYFMIDETCEHIDCEFDMDAFEEMFT